MGGLLSAAPAWVIPTVLGVVLCIFVVLFVIGFRQGREVSLWPPRLGPRPDHPASAPQAAAPAPTASLPDESPQLAGHKFNPDDGWRRKAVVDHDKLFGVDQLIELVAAAVSSPSANWIVSVFGD